MADRDTIHALWNGVEDFPDDVARKLILADAIEEDSIHAQSYAMAYALRWAAKRKKHPLRRNDFSPYRIGSYVWENEEMTNAKQCNCLPPFLFSRHKIAGVPQLDDEQPNIQLSFRTLSEILHHFRRQYELADIGELEWDSSVVETEFQLLVSPSTNSEPPPICTRELLIRVYKNYYQNGSIVIEIPNRRLEWSVFDHFLHACSLVTRKALGVTSGDEEFTMYSGLVVGISKAILCLFSEQYQDEISPYSQFPITETDSGTLMIGQDIHGADVIAEVFW